MFQVFLSSLNYYSTIMLVIITIIITIIVFLDVMVNGERNKTCVFSF